MTIRSEPFAWSRGPSLAKFAIAVSLLGFVGLFVIGRTLTIAYYSYLFNHEAVSTVGTVTDLSEWHSSRGTGYYVTFTYDDNLGLRYSTKRAVYYPEWKSFAISGKVPVLYLPSDSSVNRLNLPADQYYYQQEGGSEAFLFGGFLILVSAGLIAAAYWTKGPMFTSSTEHHRRVKTEKFHRTYKS